MVTVGDVRSELQLKTSEMSDSDISYAIGVAGSDINLVCAKVLDMILAKNRGKTKVRIGNVSYNFSATDLQALIRRYRNKSASTFVDDGVAHPDAIFTRSGM